MENKVFISCMFQYIKNIFPTISIMNNDRKSVFFSQLYLSDKKIFLNLLNFFFTQAICFFERLYPIVIESTFSNSYYIFFIIQIILFKFLNSLGFIVSIFYGISWMNSYTTKHKIMFF